MQRKEKNQSNPANGKKKLSFSLIKSSISIKLSFDPTTINLNRLLITLSFDMYI